MRILTYEAFAIVAHFAWFTVHKRVFPGAETAFFLVGGIVEYFDERLFMHS